jgi:hypothetical protein
MPRLKPTPLTPDERLYAKVLGNLRTAKSMVRARSPKTVDPVQAMALGAHVSTATMYRRMEDPRRFTLEEMHHLAQYLGVSLTKLIDGGMLDD